MEMSVCEFFKSYSNLIDFELSKTREGTNELIKREKEKIHGKITEKSMIENILDTYGL